MNYHVFIVDKYTFKYHLEYMFAGTGAGDKKVPFLTDCNTYIHPITERNLVGMIADLSRIRDGDKIIFYLQAADGNPGMFYGVFTAVSTAFFDENDSDNYLKDKMYKSLTFRIGIAPDCVYPKGVSEHDFLDSLNGVDFPYQMCWSLIYRKLKGNRGCTMITDYEFQRLISKLQSVDDNNPFKEEIINFSFDSSSFTIKENNQINIYDGRRDDISIKNRMLYKANKGNAFEVHLQAYIMQNFDKLPLMNLLLPFPDMSCWVGNEVSCGVGMQRIDTMIIQENDSDVHIKVIELKCVEPYMDILDRQLPWYIKWVKDYVVPNYTNIGKSVHIIPCVLAERSTNDEFSKKCRIFHQRYTYTNNVSVEQAEYVGFNINENDIEFHKIV